MSEKKLNEDKKLLSDLELDVEAHKKVAEEPEGEGIERKKKFAEDPGADELSKK